jgi:hypothetical protein
MVGVVALHVQMCHAREWCAEILKSQFSNTGFPKIKQKTLKSLS